MKQFTLLVFFSISTLLATAQNGSGVFPLTSLTKIDLSLGGAGISREMKIGNKLTFLAGAGMGGGYDVSEDGIRITWSILSPAFYINASPRLYYNREKRASKVKDTKFNSGNYVGLGAKYATANLNGDPAQRAAMMVNGHWGMQRYMGRKWVFDTHIGAGYAWDINNGFGTIYPSLELKFSYVLNK
jgi:hypothetical protein